jgi:ABC-type amino acid transport substrate-binding protein
MAHTLARDLGVSLEFVPLDRQRLTEQLAAGYCDVAMSGIVVTALRAETMLFTDPYLEETEAFFVKDYLRDEFRSWEAIGALRAPRIAVPAGFNVEPLQRRLPRARFVRYGTAGELVELLKRDADAALLPAERGSAWTLLHPDYSVVIPGADPPTSPLAYAVGGADRELADFLNTWIDLKRRDGTIRALYDHWVLGKEAAPHRPRWSVVRDVLHWTD